MIKKVICPTCKQDMNEPPRRGLNSRKTHLLRWCLRCRCKVLSPRFNGLHGLVRFCPRCGYPTQRIGSERR